MRRGLAISALVGLVLVVSLLVHVTRPLPASRDGLHSSLILSPNATRLAGRLSADGYWREDVRLDQIDPKLIDVLLAYEDQRFWSHWGVDPLALGRSVLDSVRLGRVSSGASTLTMQTARLMYPELGQKTVWAKFRQMLMAFRIEYHLSKTEILERYFSLAPYGGNIEGIQAGAYAWLNRPPNRLTYREAAFFVALPQSPETRRPDRYLQRAERSTSHVLATVAPRLGIEAERLIELQNERIPIRKSAIDLGHLHLIDRLGSKTGGTLTSTIDAEWQERVSQLVKSHIQSYPSSVNAGAIVVERRTGNVRAYVGSSDYLSEPRKGGNNYLQALRSPGSTLKPLIYGLALDRGLLTSTSLMADTRVQVDGYAPTNFDDGFSGQAMLRDALLQSLNIPAINTLERLGTKRVEQQIANYLQLNRTQMRNPGLSLAVGGLSLRPEQVVELYLGLVDQPSPALNFLHDQAAKYQTPLLSKSASQALLSLLLQTDMSGQNFIVKTGTSSGYRDAWSVHVLEDFIVLVWIGAPDNISQEGMTGAASATPLGSQIIRTLELSPPVITQGLTPVSSTRKRVETACPRLIEYPENEEWIVSSDLSLSVGSRFDNVTWFLNGASVALEHGTIQLNHAGANTLSATRDGCLTAISVFLSMQN